MWKIYVDDVLIHSQKTNLQVEEPKLTQELNTCGTLTFTMYPTHPQYDTINKMKDIVKVYNGDELLFYGRVIRATTGWQKNVDYECEGCLSFFNDTIIRPYDFMSGDANTTPRDLLSYFITQHNSQADAQHQFVMGNCSITDTIVRSNSEYQSTWQNVSDKLLSSFGGYIVPRYESNSIYLDYVTEFSTTSGQAVKFGYNLKDLSLDIEGDEVASVVVPLGAQDAETGERLTIASVNNDLDYIEDADAIARYGRITKVQTWDDVTIAENLLRKANAYLRDMVNETITLSVSAIDLSNIDEELPFFKVGLNVNVNDDVHGINTTMVIQKMTYNITKPNKDTMTLNKEIKGFAKALNNTTNVIRNQNVENKNNIVDTKAEIASTKIIDENRFTTIEQTQEGIKTSVTDAVTTSKAYTDGREEVIQNTLKTTINEKADGLSLEISNVDKKVGKNTETLNQYDSYFDFTSKGLEISQNNSSTKTRYGSNGMEILTNDEVVAMAKADGFGMTTAIISEDVTSTTAWKIVPRGVHLTFTRKAN